MAMLRKIGGEIFANGNRTTVRKSSGELLGEFLPNYMIVHADNPYDPRPRKTIFKEDGAQLNDWRLFRISMQQENGRSIPDTAAPRFIQEQIEDTADKVDRMRRDHAGNRKPRKRA